jgi:hypothetical protein
MSVASIVNATWLGSRVLNVIPPSLIVLAVNPSGNASKFAMRVVPVVEEVNTINTAAVQRTLGIIIWALH